MGNQHHGYLIADSVAAFVNTNSMDFDGTDDFVEIKNESNFDFVTANVDDPFSVSVWVKNTAISSDVPLITKGSPDENSASRGWGFYIGSDHYLTLKLFNGAATAQYMYKSYILNQQIFDDTWVHLAATYDASATVGGINIYVNGVAPDFTTSGTSGGYSYLNDNTIKLYIGKFLSPNSFFTGNLDEASVWDKELSSAEVSEIFNSGTPADLSSHSASANLLGWWRLGDGDATGTDNVIDQSGNGNHGTMEASMAAGDIEADVPSGVSYSWSDTHSMDFDGTNEYIQVEGNISDFHFNSTAGEGGVDSPFSISAWVNMDDATKFRIIAKSTTTSGEWLFTVDGADKLFVELAADAPRTKRIWITSNSTVTSDEGSWHHYVMTYDGTESNGGLTFYRDGSSFASTPGSAGSYTGMRTAGNPHIGLWSGGGYANGKMNEISIWDKELSSAEVSDIYNSGSPADLGDHSAVANLIAWWRLGEGDDTSTDGVIDAAAGGSGAHRADMNNMEAGDIQTDVP